MRADINSEDTNAFGNVVRNILSYSCVRCVCVAQQNDSCNALMNVKVPNLGITKAAHGEAGSTEPIPWNQSRSAPLPAYCRIEGVISRRTGVGGEEFGITFALAMPDQWNGDFLMQGGGSSNGIVLAPLGLKAAGDTPG